MMVTMGEATPRFWTPTTHPNYRVNPNYLRNPKFCVGCFEFYLSKILRQHSKQGKKYFFCDFFSAEPIFAERIETKVFFIFAFFLRNPFL